MSIDTMSARHRLPLPLRFTLSILTALSLLSTTGCESFKRSYETIKWDINRGHQKDPRPLSRYWE